MKNIVMNLIANIKSDANTEAKVVKAISRFIPQAEHIRSWSSYDTVEGIETKELHWSFNFLGHEIEMFTTNKGHMTVNIGGEYAMGYWWETSTGHIATSRQRTLKKWETWLTDRILDVMIAVSDTSSRKYALPQELHYGKYIVFTVNAEIICKNTTTGKVTRLFHTPFGNIGWDSEFPVEIKNIIMKSFMRK
jgi:hypothetical protein